MTDTVPCEIEVTVLNAANDKQRQSPDAHTSPEQQTNSTRAHSCCNHSASSTKLAGVDAYFVKDIDTSVELEPTLWRRLAIESLGTYALAFNVELTNGNPQAGPIIGFFLVCILFLGLQISGPHMNPAITMMVLGRKGMNLVHAALMIGTQIVSAILGALSAYSIIQTRHGNVTPDPYLPEGADHAPVQPIFVKLNEDTGYLASFFIEFSLAFVFCSIAMTCASAVKNRVSSVQMLIMAIFTTACCEIMGDISGAMLNPATCIAMNIVSSLKFPETGTAHLWIYLLSVPLGGVCSGFVFRQVQRAHTNAKLRFHPSFRINNGIERQEAGRREMARIVNEETANSSMTYSSTSEL